MESWFDPVLTAANSPWAYLIVFMFAYWDAIVPIVPSETSLIACGVFATATGFSPNLFLLIAVGGLGAFLGDNTVYALGRWAEPFATKHLLSGERGKKARDRAEGWLEKYGGLIIIVARYVPGGRTAVSLTAGTVGYPWRKFRFYAAIAGFSWAAYAALLGYWGGAAFKDDPIKAVLAGIVAAFAITGLIEAGRRIAGWRRRRRHRDQEGGGRGDGGREKSDRDGGGQDGHGQESRGQET